MLITAVPITATLVLSIWVSTLWLSCYENIYRNSSFNLSSCENSCEKVQSNNGKAVKAMRTAFSATLQHVCRESKKSAQQILHQLEQLSLPLLEGLDSQLCKSITYDASLSSWQELYRLVSCLDFGTGLAMGCATLQLVGHTVCACEWRSMYVWTWNRLAHWLRHSAAAKS